MPPEKTPDTLIASVIIPSFRSGATIRRVLESVVAQEIGQPYEVIVVDSSDDGSDSIIREFGPRVRLIRLEKQTSAGEGRNIGAKSAHAELLAFIDSDCVAGADWLKLMMQNLKEDAAAVGGPIENANPESIVSCAGHILEFSQFYTRRGRFPVEHLPSGNIMIRKADFLRLGGYPTEMFPQEDRYFSWKFLRDRHDRSLIFHEKIRVLHYHRSTFLGFLRHQRRIGKAGAEFLLRTDVRGSRLVRRPFFFNLLLPIFPLVKLVKSILRTVRRKPADILLKPQVLPLIAAGQLAWMIGLAEGANFSASRIMPADPPAGEGKT
ncbi:MAG: glycosyltransferase [Candidatus Hydrogenedentota bacterium]